MLVFLIILLSAGMVILNITAWGRFKEVKNCLAGDAAAAGLMAPAGLLLLQIMGHKYCSGYEKKMESKFNRLAGPDKSRTLLKIHIAQKVTLIYLYMVFALLAVQVGGASSEGLAASLLILVLILYLSDKQIDSKIKKKKEEMERDFPVFLNKLVIMINAGLTVSGAINRIVRENKEKGSLYAELEKTVNDIASGKPELKSYEDFAFRCRMAEVSMFTSILVQNLRRGSNELVAILRMQSASCWENRKNAARRLGEEASAKLLVPMMMIFAAILIMVMAPAVMQMNF